MADTPILQKPLTNVMSPMSVDPTGGQTPEGPTKNKLARLQVILQGLIGAK